MVAKTSPDPATVGQEIAETRTLDADTLRNMATMDDALAALNDAGVVVRAASDELGDGFELVKDDDKKQLVGLPFVILEANESPGDYGRTMVTVRLMTKDGRKLIVNDGSTGIRAQVVEYVNARGSIAGLYVAHGLRASDYAYCEECKNIDRTGTQACTSCGHSPMKPGATYYLDTSK